MSDVSVLVEGGKASAGAPLGPALGPLGVNIGEVVAQINEKTKAYAGMKIPVKVAVDAATKSFEVTVGSPSTSALIKKELGLDKGAANPKTEVKGNLSIQQVRKIAEMKIGNLVSYKIKSAAKEVVGTCDSMGITIEGKKASQAEKEIGEGKFDSVLGEGAAPVAEEKPAEEKPAEEAPAEEVPAEGAKEEAPAEEVPAEGAKEEAPAEEKAGEKAQAGEKAGKKAEGQE